MKEKRKESSRGMRKGDSSVQKFKVRRVKNNES